ncbi:Lsr2 family protein [Rhodococcus sp. IEGM 1330]|uniref:histone-like nucleoid-structuring protein Lsr2 n=1 Tax=Rhodococcus sp. IEGM 1330 TaxID=3082225 RepID=UPI002952FC33|nr:Lsr2 family protein [Rhodococcus sp. IEGM 1330]MDV8022207.1 Lsr2 family protein [Rhodococcus sp. IEGM 1330]
MAKQIFVQLVDDLDDKEIPDGTGENITFSVNGNEYEIDLSDKNAKEFYRKLDYYIGHSTKVGGRKARKSTKAGATTSSTGAPKRDAAQTRAIREWAQANGYEISTRGRIPASVEEAFDAAH